METFDVLISSLIKICESDIPGHYRKKEFFVKLIRILTDIDPEDFNQFRGISVAFDEALDLAQFSGVR